MVNLAPAEANITKQAGERKGPGWRLGVHWGPALESLRGLGPQELMELERRRVGQDSELLPPRAVGALEARHGVRRLERQRLNQPEPQPLPRVPPLGPAKPWPTTRARLFPWGLKSGTQPGS